MELSAFHSCHTAQPCSWHTVQAHWMPTDRVMTSHGALVTSSGQIQRGMSETHSNASHCISLSFVKYHQIVNGQEIHVSKEHRSRDCTQAGAAHCSLKPSEGWATVRSREHTAPCRQHQWAASLWGMTASPIPSGSQGTAEGSWEVHLKPYFSAEGCEIYACKVLRKAHGCWLNPSTASSTADAKQWNIQGPSAIFILFHMKWQLSFNSTITRYSSC